MEAIPTTYNGFSFRSRLEARWAVFFDSIGVKYTYEPETLLCADNTQYTPDFYLPECVLRGRDRSGVYLEIKPDIEVDREYAKRITSSLDSKNLLLIAGDPLHLVRCAFTPHYDERNRSEQLQPWWDNYIVMMHCHHCGAMKFDFDEGNYYYCFNCDAKINGELMTEAATVARKYRFRFNSDFFK